MNPAPFTYLSICSGIEAASVAWEPLGWVPCGFAEIEKFPSTVLAHHWPEVPNLGDMTQYHEWPDTLRPHLIVGGTPCQAFSVAGLRKGLADPRGNLTLTFLAILARYRAEWVVWENVPGVLSDQTGAFGAFLGGLGELGYGTAYRVLDAQYFGVAQRRRRVFVVGHLGDWRRAAAVLFERESLRGDPAPSREKRQGSAYDLAPCLAASGRGFERTGDTRGQDCVIPEVCATLTAKMQGASNQWAPMNEANHLIPELILPETTGTICADSPPGSYTGQDAYTGRLIPSVVAFDTTQISSPANYSNPQPGDPCYPLAAGAHPPAVAFERRMVRTTGGQPQEELSHCLRADAGTGDGAPCVAFQSNAGSQAGDVFEELSPTLRVQKTGGGGMPAVAFQCKDSGESSVEVAPTLRSMNAENSHDSGGGHVGVAYGIDQEQNAAEELMGCLKSKNESGGFEGAVAFAQNTRDELREMQVVGALAAEPGMKQTSYIRQQMQVRRLTPRECERLQGFPDDHTLVPWRGKTAPDGPRYKALGNSMAVPVMRWIGQRIADLNRDHPINQEPTTNNKTK